jgi:hypothetical protein
MDDKLFQYLLSNQSAWGEYYRKNKRMIKQKKNREYMMNWKKRQTFLIVE